MNPVKPPAYKLDPAVARAVKNGPKPAQARLDAGADLLQKKSDNVPAPNALDTYLEELRKNKVAREAMQTRQASDAALKNVGGIGNVIGEDADPEAVARLNADIANSPELLQQQDPIIQERYNALMEQKAAEAPQQAPEPRQYRRWEIRPSKYAQPIATPNATASPAAISPDMFAGIARRAQPMPYYDAQMKPIAPMYSDETKKSGKKVNELDELLTALKESASTYKYNDPAMNPSDGKGEGQRYAGIMAQRLEDVPNLGSGLVSDTPTGKVVETKAALSAALAAIGRQQQQLDELKKGRG